MTDIFNRAQQAFERFPSAGTLERASSILLSGGVPLSQVRVWARDTAGAYGIAPYIQNFDRLIGRAAAKSVETFEETAACSNHQ
jgi:hypothetical protein